MTTRNRRCVLAWLAVIPVGVLGCGSSGDSYSNPGPVTGSGGSDSSGSGGATADGGSVAAEPGSGGMVNGASAASSGGAEPAGGSPAIGGSTTAVGGAEIGGAATGGLAVGGTTSTGGTATGGTTSTGGTATGGTTSTGGAAAGGTPGDGCTIGAWSTADPAVAGPFAVATEEEVGPQAGDPEEDGTVPRFTLFRPEDMTQSALCHPVITWGNGTGSTPSMYGTLLRHFASHGLVVIGSNSTNVSRGDPKPMVVGIDWVLEQNEDPSSVLYHRLDTTHIGATGHSQGAMATSQASSDARIVTSVPIEGAMVQTNLHGPAMLFCGGMDDLVGCDGAQSAFDAIDTLPAMFANYLSVDHGSWLTFFGDTHTDVEVAITAWMRVHLMGDEALRTWFYGASCTLCTDSGWEIQRKNMDQ